jgi:hypothetical protein
MTTRMKAVRSFVIQKVAHGLSAWRKEEGRTLAQRGRGARCEGEMLHCELCFKTPALCMSIILSTHKTLRSPPK